MTRSLDWPCNSIASCALRCIRPALAMTKIYKPLARAARPDLPAIPVLLALWERDGLAVNELGERLFLDSGTLTPLLKRMEAAGWLQRSRDADDERRVIVTLTPEGRALRRRAQVRLQGARRDRRLHGRRTDASPSGCSNCATQLLDARSLTHPAWKEAPRKNCLYRPPPPPAAAKASRKTDDGKLAVTLAPPKGDGRQRQSAPTPSSCSRWAIRPASMGAMKFVAGTQKKVVPADASISADVGIGPIPAGFGIQAAMRISIPAGRRPTCRRWSTPRTRSALLERHARQHRRDADGGLNLRHARISWDQLDARLHWRERARRVATDRRAWPAPGHRGARVVRQ